MISSVGCTNVRAYEAPGNKCYALLFSLFKERIAGFMAYNDELSCRAEQEAFP
jgi:hypothetical protein